MLTANNNKTNEYHCLCGKIYKHRSSLCRHKKTCSQTKEVKDNVKEFKEVKRSSVPKEAQKSKSEINQLKDEINLLKDEINNLKFVIEDQNKCLNDKIDDLLKTFKKTRKKLKRKKADPYSAPAIAATAIAAPAIAATAIAAPAIAATAVARDEPYSAPAIAATAVARDEPYSAPAVEVKQHKPEKILLDNSNTLIDFFSNFSSYVTEEKKTEYIKTLCGVNNYHKILSTCEISNVIHVVLDNIEEEFYYNNPELILHMFRNETNKLNDLFDILGDNLPNSERKKWNNKFASIVKLELTRPRKIVVEESKDIKPGLDRVALFDRPEFSKLGIKELIKDSKNQNISYIDCINQVCYKGSEYLKYLLIEDIIDCVFCEYDSVYFIKDQRKKRKPWGFYVKEGLAQAEQDNRLLNMTADIQSLLQQAYSQLIRNEYNILSLGGEWNIKIIEENPEIHNLLYNLKTIIDNKSLLAMLQRIVIKHHTLSKHPSVGRSLPEREDGASPARGPPIKPNIQSDSMECEKDYINFIKEDPNNKVLFHLFANGQEKHIQKEILDFLD